MGRKAGKGGQDSIEGVQGRVEGECKMNLNDEGTVFYDVKCDVYDRRSGMVFIFHLTDISEFEKTDENGITESHETPPPNKPEPNKPEVVNAPEIIPMIAQGGTFVVPVLINKAITLDFTIDSGAADVSIPSDVVSTLIRANTINDTDFTGTKTYVLADGTEVPSKTFTIKSLKIGSAVVDNVDGSVASEKGSLLLGQSFLRRFKTWSIDNQRGVLILEKAP
jgi:clan AA aspartic protease (TIGR02281 family)